MLEHCRLAGINCMVLVHDKERNYVKVKDGEEALASTAYYGAFQTVSIRENHGPAVPRCTC